LPGGVSGSFRPTSITNGSGTSTLTITTGGHPSQGKQNLNITGTSGKLKQQATVTLKVT
jgi:hypothetical protein